MEILEFEKNKIIKVISGGQTGVDIGGISAAFLLDIPTGGTAPKDFKTENGNCTDLRDIFDLVESNHSNYSYRTEQNVKDSNFTLILGDFNSPGSAQTIKFCRKHNKKFLTSRYLNDEDCDIIINKLKEYNNNIILNVAGNRESKNPGITIKTIYFITKIINEINKV